ncbi:MAG: hypothetical protein ABW223_04260 [Rariglobus sp.]
MRSLPLITALLAATLALTGCNTFERRAEKKADTFAALSEADRERLEKKVINVGDTADMVYIALGDPDEKRVTATAAGESATWVYNRYWQEYRGEGYGGFRRHVVRNSKTGAASVYYEPVTVPIYAERKQPIMRVVFEGGKVSVVEEAHN